MPMPTFRFEGSRIAYSEFGSGPRTVVLIHGLLLSQRMHEPLARALAARGGHVVTIDLLGHGDSDRPTVPWRYSVPLFAGQVVGLLDHLELDEAVILGTSLGANATLEVCRIARPSACAGWSSRCRYSITRSSPASWRSRPS